MQNTQKQAFREIKWAIFQGKYSFLLFQNIHWKIIKISNNRLAQFLT